MEKNYTSFTFSLILTLVIVAAMYVVPLSLNQFDASNNFDSADAALLGDLNSDGIVNVFDVAILVGHFDQLASLSPSHAQSDINNDGIVNVLDLGMLAGNFGRTEGGVGGGGGGGVPSPTPFPTDSPGVPTSTPFPTRITQPSNPGDKPASHVDINLGTNPISSPWGIYPDCVAPAIGIEDHSWWWEETEAFPRHLHYGACVPNARDTNGAALKITEDLEVVWRMVLYNNEGNIHFNRGNWHKDPSRDDVRNDFSPPLNCQSNPDEFHECFYYIKDVFPLANASSSGLKELRASPDVTHGLLGDSRQFATINFQVYIDKGGSHSNYRGSAEPIIRSWYDSKLGAGEYGYARAEFNYIELMGTDLSRSMPLLTGTVTLKPKHSGGKFNVTSKLFVDPNFHRDPQSHNDFVSDGQRIGNAIMLYTKPGVFQGSYDWDTTMVCNGVHTLYFQTEDRNPGDGMNAGAMAALVEVQNPGQPACN